LLLVRQYTPEVWLGDSTMRFEVGGVVPVLDCARNQGLEALDTRRVVEQAVRQGGVDRYYFDKHMSDAGNRLTAETIAAKIKSKAPSL
jgi:hypothetical protein